MMVIKGKLDAFWETGTEGVIWSVYEDGKEGYDGLHPIRQGDRLRILEGDEVLWEGEVDQDKETNWTAFENPLVEGDGQQCVLNHWVHWLQRGVDPEVWAGWFFEEKRAELERP